MNENVSSPNDGRNRPAQRIRSLLFVFWEHGLMSGVSSSSGRSSNSSPSVAMLAGRDRAGVVGLLYDDDLARLATVLARRGSLITLARDELEREGWGMVHADVSPIPKRDVPPRVLRLDPQPSATSRSKLGDLFEWRVDPRFLMIPLVRVARRDQVLGETLGSPEQVPLVRVRSDVDAVLSEESSPVGPEALMDVLSETLRILERRRAEGLMAQVSLEFQSDLNVLRGVAEGLLQLQGGVPLSSTQSRHLHLALLEIGGNAVEWGNRFRKEHPVELVWSWWRDRLEIVVSDQGDGFDPRHLPHAAKADDPFLHLEIRQQLGLRDGGFGLLMAQGLVDEFRIERSGRRVVMVKRMETTSDVAETTSLALDDPTAQTLEPVKIQE